MVQIGPSELHRDIQDPNQKAAELNAASDGNAMA